MTNRRGFLSSLMALTAAPLIPAPPKQTHVVLELNGRELARTVIPFIPGEVRRLKLER